MPFIPRPVLHFSANLLYNTVTLLKDFYEMNRAEKQRLRNRFFKSLGPNAAAFAALFNRSEDIGFYIKDREGRIMALNRRNLEICNIRDEWDAIGLKSSDLFPADKAASYMASDHEVLRTGKAACGVVSKYPADDSRRFELRDVHPLRNARGQLIGTVCAYRLTPESESVTDRYRDMRAVSDYIQSHYGEPIGVPQLARLAHMSESTFNRAFHAVFSTSPGRYIITTRLNAARRLLAETRKSLSEIALACGFCDQSHFCRIFRQERGLTPGAYRLKHYSTAVTRPARRPPCGF